MLNAKSPVNPEEKKHPFGSGRMIRLKRREKKEKKTDGTSTAYLNKECNLIPSHPQTMLNPSTVLRIPM